jgi:4-hydroxy-tetrahydrodipicolinate synthase
VARPGGDAVRAAELAAWLEPLIKVLFIETSPVPMKTALAAMKLCPPDVRLPLVPMEAANRDLLISSLQEALLLRAENSPARH